MLKNSKKRAKLRQKPLKMPVFSLVPVIGVEPIRYHYHGILSPARLPIPPHRRTNKLYIIAVKKSSDLKVDKN